FDMQIKEINNKLLVSNHILSELTWIDAVTRLPNNHAFVDAAKKGVKHSARYHESIALIILEVDCIDTLDDKKLKEEAEHCLIRVSNCLKEAAQRPNDFVAHYGRNVFCILLSETDYK